MTAGGGARPPEINGTTWDRSGPLGTARDLEGPTAVPWDHSALGCPHRFTHLRGAAVPVGWRPCLQPS
eukprot:840783-Prymnesium_polylepis.1